jgi:DNA polymerase III psi subunit
VETLNWRKNLCRCFQSVKVMQMIRSSPCHLWCLGFNSQLDPFPQVILIESTPFNSICLLCLRPTPMSSASRVTQLLRPADDLNTANSAWILSDLCHTIENY